MITTYTCPECRRLLRTIEALPGGTRVQCPQCRTEFDTPEEAPEPPAPRAANVPAVPRAGAKLVDEGWQSSGAAQRDQRPPRHSRSTSSRPRDRSPNTSRKVVLAFVIICLSLAVLVLIISMAHRRSQPRFDVPMAAKVMPRLQGQWELVDIDGVPPAWRRQIAFRDDGSGRLWTDNLAQDVNFRFRIVFDTELEMETHDLHGTPRQFFTVYRIEWLHNNEVKLVDLQNGESFHCRR